MNMWTRCQTKHAWNKHVFLFSAPIRIFFFFAWSSIYFAQKRAHFRCAYILPSRVRNNNVDVAAEQRRRCLPLPRKRLLVHPSGVQHPDKMWGRKKVKTLLKCSFTRQNVVCLTHDCAPNWGYMGYGESISGKITQTKPKRYWNGLNPNEPKREFDKFVQYRTGRENKNK